MLVAQLCEQGACPGDGARKQQWEESHVESILHQGGLFAEPVPVDINRVADGLEGEERNAHGEHDVQGSEVVLQQSGERLDEEIGVLEVKQGQQVGQDDHRQPDVAPTFGLSLTYAAREHPRQNGGNGHQQHQYAVHLVGKEEVEQHHVGNHQRAPLPPDEQVSAEEDDEECQKLERAELQRAIGIEDELAERTQDGV